MNSPPVGRATLAVPQAIEATAGPSLVPAGSVISVENCPETQTKPFSCTVCLKGYASAISLKNHKRSMHEGKVYPCNYDECDDTFKHPSQLSRHKRIYHKGEKYTCDQYGCGNKTFKHPSSLSVHKRTQHKKKQYTCNQDGCSGEFPTLHYLYAHKNLMHTGAKNDCAPSSVPAQYRGENLPFERQKRKHEASSTVTGPAEKRSWTISAVRDEKGTRPALNKPYYLPQSRAEETTGQCWMSITGAID